MSTTIRMEDGDIFINSAGRAETIDGADKAAQDIAEVLMTPVDRVRDYGSEIASLLIPEPVRLFAGKGLVSRKVDEAIQRLKRFQQRDSQATKSERIDKINRLVVENISSTDYVFWLSVSLEDKSIASDQILGVSLRHQESAKFSETIQNLVRRTIGSR